MSILQKRLFYAAETVVILLFILLGPILFPPLAVLALPAPFLSGYAVIRPTWWDCGPREPRRYARQYVHLAAAVRWRRSAQPGRPG
jgi:hypothetical protein